MTDSVTHSRRSWAGRSQSDVCEPYENSAGQVMDASHLKMVIGRAMTCPRYRWLAVGVSRENLERKEGLLSIAGDEFRRGNIDGPK